MGQETSCLLPEVGTCTAAPYALYTNPVLPSTAGRQCPLPGFISSNSVAYYLPVPATVCGGGCCGNCKAYIAQVSTFANFAAVTCYYYSTQLTSPTTTSLCATNFDLYDDQYVYYRDDVQGCFASSSTAAERFCSYALSRPGPTATSLMTSSYCTPPARPRPAGGGGGQQLPQETAGLAFPILGVQAPDDGQAAAAAMPIPQPLAVATAAGAAGITPFPAPMPTGRPPRGGPELDPESELKGVPQLGARAASAPPPACLDTVAFPRWNVASACSCLLTPYSATATRTVLTSVQKSPVPTFRPRVGVDGDTSVMGKQFLLLSRNVTDVQGNVRRALIYSRRRSDRAARVARADEGEEDEEDEEHEEHEGEEEDGLGDGDDYDDEDEDDVDDTGHGARSAPSERAVGQGVAMHVNSEGRLFIVSQKLNYLRPYGQITLLKMAGGQTVLGQHAKGTGSSPDPDALYDCVAPQQEDGRALQCKLRDGSLAVFSEVRIPGPKKKNRPHVYAIAVGRSRVKGARTLTLRVSRRGTVLVGCGSG
ncbi:hypothetical protein Micbo1qcDRAFT_219975 [Microdochium bolleyi]|uniref:Uncharacterized protein n=1 Tax=Microdochium bolleyi TaxID=196109 RepID=A0A136IMP0_9PEZI|nr:hypothetical protein Micbo1qcDRAFT_219975 [Microdochium bolleyi]